jgi:hypothetical protein
MSLYFWIFLGSGVGGLARSTPSATSLPVLDGRIVGGLVTREKVQVVRYRHENGARKQEGMRS